MDWFGLLDKFHIDLEHPEKLQIGAKTGAYTLVYTPLSDMLGTQMNHTHKDVCYKTIEKTILTMMKNGFYGNIIQRTSLVKKFISNEKDAKLLRDTKLTDISFDTILHLVKTMHLHNMSDQDFEALAEELTRLLLDNGPLQQIIDNNMVLDEKNLKVVTAISADRLYTAFTLSLQQRSAIQSKYEQSVKKNGEIK